MEFLITINTITAAGTMAMSDHHGMMHTVMGLKVTTMVMQPENQSNIVLVSKRTGKSALAIFLLSQRHMLLCMFAAPSVTWKVFELHIQSMI